MPTLEWIGKDKVINHHQEVPYRLFDRKYTYGVQDSENMIIHGDQSACVKITFAAISRKNRLHLYRPAV